MDYVTEKVFVEHRPQERSGHTAVLERNLLYVWGGFRVGTSKYIPVLFTLLFCLTWLSALLNMNT